MEVQIIKGRKGEEIKEKQQNDNAMKEENERKRKKEL